MRLLLVFIGKLFISIEIIFENTHFRPPNKKNKEEDEKKESMDD
jgi:hypothetical protein